MSQLKLESLIPMVPLEPIRVFSGLPGMEHSGPDSFGDHLVRARDSVGAHDQCEAGGTEPNRPPQATPTSKPAGEPTSSAHRPDGQCASGPVPPTQPGADSGQIDRPTANPEQRANAKTEPGASQEGLPDEAASGDQVIDDVGHNPADADDKHAPSAGGAVAAVICPSATGELIPGAGSATAKRAQRDSQERNQSGLFSNAAAKSPPNGLSPSPPAEDLQVDLPPEEAQPTAGHCRVSSKQPGKFTKTGRKTQTNPPASSVTDSGAAEGPERDRPESGKSRPADQSPTKEVLSSSEAAQATEAKAPAGRRVGTQQAGRIAASHPAGEAVPSLAWRAAGAATQNDVDETPPESSSPEPTLAKHAQIDGADATPRPAMAPAVQTEPAPSARTQSAQDPQPASAGRVQSRPGAEQMDRVRFVQRVARAFEALGDHGGSIRLRLHPPELGSLRLELTVRDGVMRARMEADSPAARNALLDNLPALRERLAEQQIKVEQFEVDLREHSSGGWGQQPAHQPRTETHQAEGRAQNRRRTGDAESTAVTRAAILPDGTGFDVVI